MSNQSHFTTCNICNKSIQLGEQYVSLNFHRETGNCSNGQKTITVHFADSAITTCIDCGKLLSEFVMSRDLVDHFRNRIQNMVQPTASKEETIRENDIPAPLSKVTHPYNNMSGSDTGMTIDEVDGITPVPALKNRNHSNRKLQTSEQRTFALAKKLNLSESQIEYLKSIGSGEASIIVSLIKSKDNTLDFDGAVAAIDDFLFLINNLTLMSNHSAYDIIGDIHGHASELEALLKKMGYNNENGYYSHSTRKVLFVGDYIDRGPQIREVLHIVKAMTDNDQAIALMGNHEYNCLCYHTKNSDGKYLRAHTEKNKHQHQATLSQFESYPEEWSEYLEWMWSLPLWYESKYLRAVHACWSAEIISLLQSKTINNKLSPTLLQESADESNDLYDQIEITLKGKELPLPEGYTFMDKDNHPRKNVRIKWWMDSINVSYNEFKVNQEYDVPDVLVDHTHPILSDVYPIDEKPVFFGHYWLRGEPSIYRSNVCCLDYSVAKNGKLVAYRFDIDQEELSNDNLVW